MHDSCEPGSNPLPAWLLSLIFHACLLAVIGWFSDVAAPGQPRETDRPIGVALVESRPDRDLYREVQPSEASQDQAETAQSQTAPATAAAAAPASFAPPVDLAGMLATMTAGDVPSVGNDDLAGTLGDGVDTFGGAGRPQADGAPTTAMLFGVSGSGSRFVYVLDRSDSMNGYGGKPLRAAKAELKRSLQSLTQAQQFQIVFYNEEARPFIPAGMGFTMLSGEPSMLRRAVAYIDSVKAFGGTEHFGALKMALRMGPDVIFFLTDARVPRLNSSQFADVRQLAERSGASIHAIEFGPETTAPADSFLRQLAAENRGEYRYVQMSQLGTAAFDIQEAAAQAVEP